MIIQHYHSGVQTIHDIYFEFSCSDLIKKMELCLMVVSVLLENEV